MKKLATLLLITAIATLSYVGVFAQRETYVIHTVDYKLYVNDTYIPTTMINHEGRTYLKLRDMANIFGLGIEWVAETQTIVMTVPKEKYMNLKDVKELPVRKEEALIGYPSTTNLLVQGFPLNLDKIVFQDYTYFQLRQITDLADIELEWNPDTNSININTQKILNLQPATRMKSVAPITGKETALTYEGNTENIVGFKDGAYYMMRWKSLYRSKDLSQNWEFLFTSDESLKVAHFMKDGTIVTIDEKGNVYRSDDGKTFEKLEAKVEGDEKLGYPTRTSIDSFEDTIVFGEQTPNKEIRVFVSHDKGVTWKKTYSFKKGDEANLIQSVNYNPYNKKFYVVTGWGNLSGWYESNDLGSSWLKKEKFQGDRYRTSNIYFEEDGTIIWGAYSWGVPAVYRTKIDGGEIEKLLTLNGPLRGLTVNGDKIVAVSFVESKDRKQTASIAISEDGGKTWATEHEGNAMEGYPNGGFNDLQYFPENDSYLIRVSNLEGAEKTSFSLIGK